MLRQPEFIHRPDMRVNHAENNFDAESLAHYTSAVTGELVRIRKIGITACLEFPFIRIRNKSFGQERRVLRAEPRCAGPDRLQGSMQTPDRLGVHGEMNIGGGRFLADFVILIDVAERVRSDRYLRNACNQCADGGGGCKPGNGLFSKRSSELSRKIQFILQTTQITCDTLTRMGNLCRQLTG